MNTCSFRNSIDCNPVSLDDHWSVKFAEKIKDVSLYFPLFFLSSLYPVETLIMFQNSAKDEHYIHSHQRCPVCHRMADSLEFYHRHIFQLSVVVYFHSKLCKTAVRNFQTGGKWCVCFSTRPIN